LAEKFANSLATSDRVCLSHFSSFVSRTSNAIKRLASDPDRGLKKAVARDHDIACGAGHKCGRPSRRTLLLQLDGGADRLELLLHLFGVFLRNAFFHILRRALDEILGFLEAKAGDGADFLDHFDLLLARLGENNRELGLLLDWSRRSGPRGSSHRDRSRGGYAPFLFQYLRQLG